MIDTIITSGLIILGWFGREASDYWDRQAEERHKKLDAAVMLCREKNDCRALKVYLGQPQDGIVDTEHVAED